MKLSSEGSPSPAPAVFRHCLKLNIIRFPYNLILVVTLDLKKNHRSGRAWQPAAGSNGRWRTFLKFEARQTAIVICSELQHPTQQVKILKKVRQTAITICSGLL
jgi:hypothetical protein